MERGYFDSIYDILAEKDQLMLQIPEVLKNKFAFDGLCSEE